MFYAILGTVLGLAVCFFLFAVIYSRRQAGQLSKVEPEPGQAPRRLEALRLP
jgi:hypothetical protein